jgi:hypothetical protein
MSLETRCFEILPLVTGECCATLLMPSMGQTDRQWSDFIRRFAGVGGRASKNQICGKKGDFLCVRRMCLSEMTIEGEEEEKKKRRRGRNEVEDEL